MPKHTLRTSMNTSNGKNESSSRCKKRKQFHDESSSSASSNEIIRNKKAIILKPAQDDINSDEAEINAFSEINPEIEKLFRNFQAKMKKVVEEKAKKIEDLSCGKLQKHLKLISNVFSSLEEKVKTCCTLFDAQNSEIYKKIEKEQEEFNEQVDKLVVVLEQIIQSYLKFKASQQKNVHDLQEINASFTKNMTAHIQNMHKNCNVSLNNLEKDVQTLLKNIMNRKQKHGKINFKNSLNSIFW